ncbi:PIG-L deacetylase family protein [Colwelliaceae bacterium 6441]
MNKVLVVVAHSDDETLGMGATIARHYAQGDEVRLIVMTNGVSARKNIPEDIKTNQDDAKTRRNSLKQVANILGISQIYQFELPDNQMDNVPLLKVVQTIESVIEAYPAEIIYTHSSTDLNIDHSITHQAVITACRPQPQSSVKKIFSFEVRSATEWQASSKQQFIANYFTDVTDFMDKKIQALNCYPEELREFPHSRSIEAIQAHAITRGTSVGIAKAEAFYVERIIN